MAPERFLDDPFAGDERVRFYLRHQREIRLWAKIRDDVITGTHRLLAGTTAQLESMLADVAPAVIVDRQDREGGRGSWPAYSRVMARRMGWPPGFGVTLEWLPEVDPFGKRPLKYGVFARINHSAVEPIAARLARQVVAAGLTRVPGTKQEKYWPLSRLVPASNDWWERPIEWRREVCALLVDVWKDVAPLADQAVGAPADAD